MQLNEILEENTLKSMSKKTNISEEDIERLLAGNFSEMKRAKALGFISIIEREYNADLSALKAQAKTFYEDTEEDSITLSSSVDQLKGRRKKSKLFSLLFLLLLGYAIWYFFTQFDKKQLNDLFDFDPLQKSESVIPETIPSSDELTIESVTVSVPDDTSTDVAKEKIQATEENITVTEENLTQF